MKQTQNSPAAIAPLVLPSVVKSLVRGRAKEYIREGICSVVDAHDRLRGLSGDLVPPCRLRVRVGCFLSFVRVQQYRAVAAEFLKHMGVLVDLQSTMNFLDIGCGCGQIASALADMPGFRGRYEGIDPDIEAIEWCRTHVTASFPAFQFKHSDIANAQYNPGGTLQAERFSFPYESASADVILLKSVFTHLRLKPLTQYLREIRRLLQPGGTCIATFYLLNEEAHRLMGQGKSRFAFPYEDEGCRVADRITPEYLVAYEEEDVRELARQAGLQIRGDIQFGSWCGRESFLSFQDVVAFEAACDLGNG